jgi:hypothetical protein
MGRIRPGARLGGKLVAVTWGCLAQQRNTNPAPASDSIAEDSFHVIRAVAGKHVESKVAGVILVLVHLLVRDAPVSRRATGALLGGRGTRARSASALLALWLALRSSSFRPALASYSTLASFRRRPVTVSLPE